MVLPPVDTILSIFPCPWMILVGLVLCAGVTCLTMYGSDPWPGGGSLEVNTLLSNDLTLLGDVSVTAPVLDVE